MKVAVIGVGRWGKNHVRVLKGLCEKGLCDEVIVCDKNLERARQVAIQNNIEKAYSDIDSMISKEHPEAAILAVPTVFHYKIARKLISKLNLLIEKPLARDLEEGYDLVMKTLKSGNVVTVGHIERFNQAILAIKEITKGEKLVYISAQRLGPGPAKEYTLNLGVTHDLLVHDIDIVNHILNELPKRVFSMIKKTSSFPYEIENSSLFKYKDTVAYLRASWQTSPKLKKRQLIVQSLDSIITLDYITQSYTIERGLIEQKSNEGFIGTLLKYQGKEVIERKLLPLAHKEPLLAEDMDFLLSIKNNKPPHVSIIDGYVALKSICYSLKSAEDNRAIEIPWNETFLR